ncbi:uncharacterized protein LOC121534667 [Coregonus clupeaformis]|uniref:Uncharacterized protein n=1 Tax=Coregonus suidteri TaxID=861788 RepID=A0AAN8LI27_9TELE|nr:uncharacterized protein LOC121534667 [Coregonus clupeaformis]
MEMVYKCLILSLFIFFLAFQSNILMDRNNEKVALEFLSIFCNVSSLKMELRTDISEDLIYDKWMESISNILRIHKVEALRMEEESILYYIMMCIKVALLSVSPAIPDHPDLRYRTTSWTNTNQSRGLLLSSMESRGLFILSVIIIPACIWKIYQRWRSTETDPEAGHQGRETPNTPPPVQLVVSQSDLEGMLALLQSIQGHLDRLEKRCRSIRRPRTREKKRRVIRLMSQTESNSSSPSS